jgi:hypothetical protein
MAALAGGSSLRETAYLQLATVDRNGLPRNRTLVFRGFGPDSEILLLTDRRSAKHGELQALPRAELAWYFPATREQFRLTVAVALHGSETAAPWCGVRQHFWEARGAQGQSDWLEAVPAAPLPQPVDAFILMACEVEAADHLSLRPTPQEHWFHRLNGGEWEVTPHRP